MKEKFKVLFLEDAINFIDKLDDKTREKVIYNIRKAQIINYKELFKKLNDEIWEFRTLFNKTQYRLFAFWDKGDKDNILVIATHGLIKKTGKTPENDLEKAEKLRKTYFKQKS